MADETCPCTEENISSYWLSRTAKFPGDILKFDHSFGYNCKRLYNLCLINPDFVVYASGNFLHFYQISTKQVTFRRSASGNGIGFILKNPNPQYNYLTVAENGINPNIFIYDFPSMDIISILEDGALFTYTTCVYRQDGELLATQSGEPDYMITIWRWSESKILLRTKSFQNDVLNVIFSPYNPILLVTCGLSHIKFWKMARTFTGLKLQGDLGRFGKTEISDIFAIYPMGDETVISGCDWGNLLLWEAGLIKLEVCRKTRKPCHTSAITLILMDDEEIMTAGLDGYIRMWFWETVELADPPEDDRFVEIEPIFEFYVGNKDSFCEIRGLVKIYPENKENTHYYAQDGNGGIWFCDLNKDDVPLPSYNIFVCHGGKVVSGDSSPISPHIATFGENGDLNFYNYEEKRLDYTKKYATPGCDLIWLSTTIDATGLVLLLAFGDGVMRQICVQMSKEVIVDIYLINVMKAHRKEITKLSINPLETILVSAAKDNTIFLYQIQRQSGMITRKYAEIIPIGFIETPSFPTAITWKNNENTIALACSNGEILELSNLPDKQSNIENTYQLNNIEKKQFKFSSIKSLIRLQIKIDAKAAKMEKKKELKLLELKKLQQLNPGMIINENIQVEDSDKEEEEEPLFFPKKPNPIFWLRYTPLDTIWISVGGYDAGYIYEIEFGLDKPVRSTIINNGDDVEIYSYYAIGKYLIWAIQGGSIRINYIENNAFTVLTDYWLMGMHDNKFANVPKIFLNFDGTYLFTIGHDGNIFSYLWNGPIIKKPVADRIAPFMQPKTIADIDYVEYPSLEQQKYESEKNRRLKISNERKAKILDIVSRYRYEYEVMLKENLQIKPSQQFQQYELDVDPRITEDLIYRLREQLNLIKNKLDFDVQKAKLGKDKVLNYFTGPLEQLQFTVQGIRQNIAVNSFKIYKLSPDIEDIKEEIRIRLLKMKHLVSEDNQKSDDEDDNISIVDQEDQAEIVMPPPFEEKFFLGHDPSTIVHKFSVQMQRVLKKYRARKHAEVARYIEWEKIKQIRPNINKNDKADDIAIRLAKKSIGDFKLKINADYIPPASNNVLNKYQELLKAREQLFKLKNDYNKKILRLRTNKKKLYNYIDEKRKYLKKLQQQIPVNNHKEIEEVSPINYNLEYPEDNLKELVKCGTGIHISELMDSDEPDIENVDNKNKLESTIYKYSLATENYEHEEFLFKDLEWEMLDIQDIKTLPDFNELSKLLDNPFQLTDKTYNNFIDSIHNNDSNPMNDWKIEKCYRWIIDKIIEQDFLLSDISTRIDDFDNEVDELNKSKLRIEIDAKFLEIFILTLNEELNILKDSEHLEMDLVEKTDIALESRNSYVANIQEANKKNEELRKSNEKMNEQIKSIQANFTFMVKGTKFYDFLRKIFIKKYKPPKEKSGDSESESESSSSSSGDEEAEDDDEEKSNESVEITPIRLDENVCPPGCDPKLFDLTYTLRNERHELERSIYLQTRSLEDDSKKVNDMLKQLKTTENLYIEEKQNLTNFRLKKQKVLNKVETLVIVNMDQMQYAKNDSDINDINGSLLFKYDILKKLNSRVGEIDLETLETRRVHRVNIVHLQRMTTDCTYMTRLLGQLDQEIQTSMIKKFGQIVDFDELQESTIRNTVYTLQLNLPEYMAKVDREIEKRKITLEMLEKELCRETQKASEKLNILTILQEEKNYLTDVLAYQRKLSEKSTTAKHIDLRPDIKRLSNIKKVQKAQIEFLEREIRTLSIKSKPLEVQPAENVLNTSGLPGIINEDDQKIDESAFINLQSISYQFGPDVYTSDRIYKIVLKFLIKHFRKLMSDDNIRKYSKTITQYLGFVGKNYDYEQTDKITNCIVENFQNLLPKKYLFNLKTNDIKALFNEIIVIFNYEKAEVNIDEVLNGIVENAFEIATHVNKMNFTQTVMVELYKELIEVLTIDDICKSTTLDKLCELLTINPKFIPKCINPLLLVQEIMDHAKLNFITEFTKTPVQRTVEELILKLSNKIIKPTKL